MRKGLMGFFLGVSLLLGADALAEVWPSEEDSWPCQILDTMPEPVYRIGLGYVPESRFKGYGKTDFLEIDGDWAFAYYRDVFCGDIDLNLRFDAMVLFGSAGLQLPDQVGKIALDAGWTWRSREGTAAQIRLLPGLYSDLEEIDAEAFSLPFSLALIRAFNPCLSGIAGVEIRPDFDRIVMPLVGIEWEIWEAVRLEARLPESRLVYFVTQDWSTYLGFEWQSMSYALRKQGWYDRKLITFEDFRIWWGLAHFISDELQLIGEVGSTFERSVEFEGEILDLDNDVHISKATFVRFALSGPF